MKKVLAVLLMSVAMVGSAVAGPHHGGHRHGGHGHGHWIGPAIAGAVVTGIIYDIYNRPVVVQQPPVVVQQPPVVVQQPPVIVQPAPAPTVSCTPVYDQYGRYFGCVR